MIEVIRNEENDIIAICGYLVLDGEILTPTGKEIFIEQLEVNRSYRNKGVLQQMGKRLMKKHPTAMICEWSRDGRVTKLTKEQGERIIKGV